MNQPSTPSQHALRSIVVRLEHRYGGFLRRVDLEVESPEEPRVIVLRDGSGDFRVFMAEPTLNARNRDGTTREYVYRMTHAVVIDASQETGESA